MRTRYRFDHSWHVDAVPDAVLALLEDVAGYERWWPGLCALGGRAAAPGPREAELEVRAPAGYRIRLTLRETAARSGELRARIAGDLDGWCAWRVTPDGPGARVDFSQEVEARRPLLRLGSALLRGALQRQHARVMERAAAGMREALADRSRRAG